MKENAQGKKENTSGGNLLLFRNRTAWMLSEIPLTLLLGAICGTVSVTFASLELTEMAFINILNTWLEDEPFFSLRMGRLMGEGAVYGSMINLIMVGIIGYRSADEVENKGIVITSLIAGVLASVLAAIVRWR